MSLFASIGAGCAAIAGLGDLEKVDCASDCDGGPDDVTSGDDGSTHDVVVSDSLGSHDSSTDATNADSAGGDTSTSDTGSDATAADAMDASADADALADAIADSMTTDEPDVVEPPDAAPDSGCGPIDTTTNCGACGATCTETHATADTCNGTACSYTCGSGFQDCNAATGHNTDGCECAGTACCSGGTCQPAHPNGVGQTYYDCSSLGTFNELTANEACIAFVGAANAANCMDGFFCVGSDDASVGDMICATGTQNTCDCWGYDGMIAGKVEVSNGHGTMANNYSGCGCPNPGVAWQ